MSLTKLTCEKKYIVMFFLNKLKFKDLMAFTLIEAKQTQKNPLGF